MPFPGRPFTAFSHQTCGANQRLVTPLLGTCHVYQQMIFLLPLTQVFLPCRKVLTNISSSSFQAYFKNLPLNFKLETKQIVIPPKSYLLLQL